MPVPVSSPASAAGNIVSATSLASGKNLVTVVDASNLIEAQLTCEVTTGSSAPTTGVSFSACKAYAAGATGSAPPITLTGSATSGGTSLTVSGTTGLQVGQVIAVVSAATGIGEAATISAISGTTLTVGALENSYASGAYVYTYTQTASFVVTPANPSTGSWAANKDYSAEAFLGPAKWVIVVQGDGTQQTTVTITLDKITAIQ